MEVWILRVLDQSGPGGVLWLAPEGYYATHPSRASVRITAPPAVRRSGWDADGFVVGPVWKLPEGIQGPLSVGTPLK